MPEKLGTGHSRPWAVKAVGAVIQRKGRFRKNYEQASPHYAIEAIADEDDGRAADLRRLYSRLTDTGRYSAR